MSNRRQNYKKNKAIWNNSKDWDVEINFGIKTGYNKAFIIDEDTRNKLIKEDSKFVEIIKSILRGRNIKRYSYNFANLYLINSHNGTSKKLRIDINRYLAIRNHLDKYYKQLKNRQYQCDTPYNLRNCAYIDSFKFQNIAWQKINQKPSFCLTQNETLILDSMAF